jgi:hypothetical protein
MECDLSERSKHYGTKFIIDKSDYDRFVKPYSFCLNNEGYVLYSSSKDGLNGKKLHRMIMGDPPDNVIDHVNHNKLDNRRQNLRVCTHQQNQFNRGKNSNNTSGYKGVHWNKQTQKWKAQINHKYLGLFDSAEEAHRAYVRAAQELHGEYANFGLD